jgi:aldehyde dehydrogenase (NAD+)
MPTFDYAPAPESRDIVDLRSSYGLFINGEFTEPAAGTVFKTVNPATEEVLAEVSEAGDADVDRAVRGTTGSGPSCRAASAASTCSGSPG